VKKLDSFGKKGRMLGRKKRKLRKVRKRNVFGGSAKGTRPVESKENLLRKVRKAGSRRGRRKVRGPSLY